MNAQRANADEANETKAAPPMRAANPTLTSENQATLARLVTILDYAEGFTLLFARCNLPPLRRQLAAAATNALAARGIRTVEIDFNTPVHELRRLLRERLAAIEAATEQPVETMPEAVPALHETEESYATAAKIVLFVSGLEQSIPYDQPNARLLAELNLGRELFQRELPHPLLLWLPDYAITAVARHAPDFWAWRSGVFEFESDATARAQTFERYVYPDGDSLAVRNLSTEQKLRRRRLLESLLDDYADQPDNEHIQTERSRVLYELGQISHALFDLSQALAYYEQALPLRRQVGDKAGEAVTLNNLGGVYSDLDDRQPALAYFEQALPLWHQVGDKAGEAATLNNLGMVYSDLGDKQQALVYYERALWLSRQVEGKAGEATTLNNLGGVYDDLGDKQQALAYYLQALTLRRQVDDKVGEATTLNNLGMVYADLGDKQQALVYFEQALPLWQQVGDRWGENITLYNMGMVYQALGDLAQAAAHLQQVVAIDEAVGHPDLASDRAALARVQALREQG